MKKSIFFILLLFSSSTLSYERKHINLSSHGFTRYVRPQLLSITHDYQTLLMALNPELKGLKMFQSIFKSLNSDSKKITALCSKKRRNLTEENHESCLFYFQKSMRTLRSGTKLLEKMPNLTNKKHFTPEDALQSFSSFQVFQKNFTSLLMLYESSLFFIQARIALPSPLHNLSHQGELTYNFLNIFLIKSSDNRFRNEFMAFWNDFIKPVSNLILPQNNKELFISKINKLNLRLHFLNVALTKRNKDVNKQAKVILKTLHRRWSSILKVTLKR